MKQKLTLLFDDGKPYKDFRQQFKSEAAMNRQVAQDGEDFAAMLENLYHTNGETDTRITCRSAKVIKEE